MSPAPERAMGDELWDIFANAVFFPVPVEEVLDLHIQQQPCRRQERGQRRRQQRKEIAKAAGQYHTPDISIDSLPDVLVRDEERRSDLNISDVLEAISLADPLYELSDGAGASRAAAGGAMAGGAMERVQPYVRIVEQPASKALRFRYECEGRSAGSIPGVNSTTDHKTFPTIEVGGYTGKAIVFVSCVTKDQPYKPHPHNLVGRDRCEKGVCTQKVDVTPENNKFAFSNLGIQCVKRRDIAEALKVREDLRVDPFRTGYGHRNQPQSIDLNAVRLCFQVFITGEGGRMRQSLPPVVSDIIYDKKAMSDLQIMKISSCAGPARGGQDIILLCEKVTREDISVVFLEERRVEGAGGGGAAAVVWEEPANIVLVHKQYAIACTAPPYREPATGDHVEVFIQLKRPTDNARSNSVQYTYIPEYQETDYIGAKRRKPLRTNIIAQIERERAAWQAQDQKPIKSEPSDKSPLHMGSPHHQNFAPIDRAWLAQPLAGIAEAAAVQYGAYGGDLQWPATTYQTMSPAAMQVPTMSSAPRSPMHNLPATSPGLQHAHGMQVMSPNMQQVMSPQHQVMSPQHQQVMSPQHQVMSPQHQVMSPQHQVMSPQQHQVMSPQQHQVISPQQHQVMSPQHQQVMSPQHQQVMSPPHQQVMSPHMVVSPQGHLLDERGAAMGHVSPNLGHVSPNMQQQMQQPMETNSTPSLSRLLEGGEGINELNSGDLSTLSAMLAQPYRQDLTDSLTRLSTSDLMFPRAEL